MTKKTTQDLGQVFDGFVEVITDIVKNGEEEVTKDGDVVRVKPKAATLGVIRQFLKDQNITASPEHKGIKKLLDIPFSVDDDVQPEQRIQ
jgi:ABC-type antimicrobial peptide transport system ATPase subunit